MNFLLNPRPFFRRCGKVVADAIGKKLPFPVLPPLQRSLFRRRYAAPYKSRHLDHKKAKEFCFRSVLHKKLPAEPKTVFPPKTEYTALQTDLFSFHI